MRNRTFSTTIIAAVIFFVPSLLLAAGLGKLTVNSGLGQPLRAEIELLAVEKDELGSLGARLASPDAFQQAGISYSANLAQLKLAVEKNSRGQAVIMLTSAQPFDEPFLDLLVELTWSTGRIVREYTALLDPPDFGIPLVPPVAVVPEKLPATKPAPAASVAASAAPASAGSSEYGPVKSGETLSRIANAVKPSDVNLEQALVSLYRANQNAFIGNMNRLKSGQILRVPHGAEFANVARTEAIAEVKAQTANWNAYRQKLGLTPVAVADARSAQSASGRISVADAGAEKSESQEVLRISKAEVAAAPKAQAAGALQEKIRTLEEEILSKERAVNEANERVAILEKQVGEMKRLVELKGQPAAPETKPEAPASIADNKSQAPADSSKPAVTERLAVPAPKKESGSLLDDIMQNPLYLAAIALIVGLAALFGIRAIRRKREETSVVAQEPSLASEHNQVAEPEVATQTVIAKPGAEDMDPLSEAEVYLAYDREQQAEEILKDGLKKTPARHELHLKLLEIYSRRSDISAFDAIIRQLYNATAGMGPMWERAATMGFALDPDNPLYALAEPADFNSVAETVEDEPMLEQAPQSEEPTSTVLELGFDAKSEPAEWQTEPVFASDDTLILDEKTEEPQAIEPELPPEKLIATIDFNTERRHFAAAETDINFERRIEEPEGEEIVFEKPVVLDFTPEEEAYSRGVEEPVMASAGKNGNGQAGDIAFTPAAQLSDIDLNLEDQPAPANGQDEMWQQVEIKFDLARAYQDMGEKEGAREILEEVIKDGDAKQQRAARSMLANL